MTAPALQLIETKISEQSVHMRYANHSDPTSATAWIDLQVPVADLKYTAGGGGGPLGDLDLQFLAEIRLATLRFVRDAIGDETRRLTELAGRSR